MTFMLKRRHFQQFFLDPAWRSFALGLGLFWGGFALSGASLLDCPQPLVLGLICALKGWPAALMSFGALAGYPSFWGEKGVVGILWTASGGLLTILTGKFRRDQPLMLPVLAACFTAASELAVFLVLRQELPLGMRILRTVLTALSAILFTQAISCRDPVTDWLAGGVLVLALAKVGLPPGFSLGTLAAGAFAVAGAFPAAALAGLGLDLAGSATPMSGVLCLAYLIRLIPFRLRWQHYAAPTFAYLIVTFFTGTFLKSQFLALSAGGFLAFFLPTAPQSAYRRGQTGAAQVRLEMSADLMSALSDLCREAPAPAIDAQAILDKATNRACNRCPERRTCTARENFSVNLLHDPLEADCQRQERLISELRRGREQFRLLEADHRRRAEYRTALQQQYGFLSQYLRRLADSLPRAAPRARPQFRIQAAARSRSKEGANGDRCIAFPGRECRYYVLLCDGMGTGLGAAREGACAASVLRQMLTAGFPARDVLATFNSLLTLTGKSGFVTIDLAELHLDTGHAHLYKFGAAPSLLCARNRTEKIGTATFPPGLESAQMWEKKLSLRRGEVLVLLSDGVSGEGAQAGEGMELPPGELAARILEQSTGSQEDDATVAAIRLLPTTPLTS